MLTMRYLDVDFLGCQDCKNCIEFNLKNNIYKCNGQLKQLCRMHFQAKGMM
jgi:hypothetical protein